VRCGESASSAELCATTRWCLVSTASCTLYPARPVPICALIRKSGISSVIVDQYWKHVTQITDRNVTLAKG
jgi:hypothetical protein